MEPTSPIAFYLRVTNHSSALKIKKPFIPFSRKLTQVHLLTTFFIPKSSTFFHPIDHWWWSWIIRMFRFFRWTGRASIPKLYMFVLSAVLWGEHQFNETKWMGELRNKKCSRIKLDFKSFGVINRSPFQTLQLFPSFLPSPKINHWLSIRWIFRFETHSANYFRLRLFIPFCIENNLVCPRPMKSPQTPAFWLSSEFQFIAF